MNRLTNTGHSSVERRASALQATTVIRIAIFFKKDLLDLKLFNELRCSSFSFLQM